MAIGLPPPPPPQQAGYSELRQEASHRSNLMLAYGHYRLHLFGDLEIPTDAIKRGVAQAKTLSDAVRSIVYTYRNAGFALPELVYAANGADIYIKVTLGGVSSIDVPKRYEPYFKALPDFKPLTAADMGSRLALASALSERGSQDGALYFRQAKDNTYSLNLVPTAGHDVSLRGSFSFGNPGNRFAGRNFASTSLILDSRYGDELTFDGLANTAALGIASGDARYSSARLSYGRVTPWGLFSVAGSYTPFRSTIASFRVRQEIDQGTISWFDTLYASFSTRLTLELGLQRTRKNATIDGQGIVLQSQIYNAVTGGLGYLQAFDAARHWLLGGGLRFTHGIGGDTQPQTGRPSLSFLLLQPTLELVYSPIDQWSFSGSVQAQWSPDRLPEEEQWVLGGTNQLTAYLPGALIGDRGLLARATVKRLGLQFRGITFTPAAFIEYGVSDYAHPVATHATRTATLSDAGISLQSTLTTWLTVKLDAARALGSSHVDSQTRRETRSDFFFSVATHF